MSEFKDRFKEALDFANINANKLANMVGITPGTVGHWKNRGTKPSGDLLLKVATALGVSAEWLLTGNGQMKVQTIIPIDNTDSLKDGFVQIPEYAIRFGAGEAAEPTYDEIEDSIPATFRLSFFTSRGINPKNCRRFHVIGDSMEPIIMSNDCITVDCSPIDHIENNQIYALYYEHSLKVKRLIKTFKSLIIHSENPAYPDEELTLEEAEQLIHIIGRVIERSGSI